MAFIAIPWFVLQTTGSASQTGITAIFTALPAILAAFFGGVIVDRIGYKRTSILADLASGAAIVLIPLLHATVGLQFWQLLALVFLGNLLDAPGATARSALSPELAELAGLSLERASAFNDAISRSTRLIGAPLAGVLIALIGAANVLWIDALTFLASAVLIAVFVPRPDIKPASDMPQHFMGQLAEGLRFVRSDRVLMAILYTVLITNMLDAAMGGVLIPVYVNRTYGSAAIIGLISGVTAGAALLSALYIGAAGIRGSRRLTLGFAFVFVSLRFWIFALSPSLPVLLIMLALTGLAIGFLNPILGAVEYERVPPNMRARVFGVLTAGVMLGTPIGGASGLLLDRIGLTPTLILLGACYFITTASLLVNPAIRDIDKRSANAQALDSIEAAAK
jgi:MFS family permease